MHHRRVEERAHLTLTGRTLMPHTARSVELIEPLRQPYARQAGRPDVGVVPDVVVTGMAGRQRRACPADGQDRHRRYEQQLMRQRPATWLHAQRHPPG
jgi:hypothetical protein